MFAFICSTAVLLSPLLSHIALCAHFGSVPAQLSHPIQLIKSWMISKRQARFLTRQRINGMKAFQQCIYSYGPGVPEMFYFYILDPQELLTRQESKLYTKAKNVHRTYRITRFFLKYFNILPILYFRNLLGQD